MEIGIYYEIPILFVRIYFLELFLVMSIFVPECNFIDFLS